MRAGTGPVHSIPDDDGNGTRTVQCVPTSVSTQVTDRAGSPKLSRSTHRSWRGAFAGSIRRKKRGIPSSFTGSHNVLSRQAVRKVRREGRPQAAGTSTGHSCAVCPTVPSRCLGTLVRAHAHATPHVTTTPASSHRASLSVQRFADVGEGRRTNRAYRAAATLWTSPERSEWVSRRTLSTRQHPGPVTAWADAARRRVRARTGVCRPARQRPRELGHGGGVRGSAAPLPKCPTGAKA